MGGAGVEVDGARNGIDAGADASPTETDAVRSCDGSRRDVGWTGFMVAKKSDWCSGTVPRVFGAGA